MSMSLSSRLRAGETVLSAWSSLPEPLTVEILAHSAFDAVTLDMQHGGHDEASILRSLGLVLNAGKPPVVRIPVGRFDMASRALDFGAHAVIAPMINSVDDARRFAAAMKYPPVGERSWGVFRANADYGAPGSNDYLTTANHDTLAFAMIETRDAYDALDAILDVRGIDGVFVGPSDFSSHGATDARRTRIRMQSWNRSAILHKRPQQPARLQASIRHRRSLRAAIFRWVSGS